MYSAQKRSSHSSARQRQTGYSLVELLVATTLVLICATVAYSVVGEARRVYDADSARTDLNQNIRASLDMLATFTRQAGERLPEDFPAVLLVDDATGDELVVRRHLVDTVLLSCTDLNGSSTRVYVGLGSGSGSCAIGGDSDSDGVPDNVEEYRAYRLAYGDGGSPPVFAAGYLFDPVTGSGEFFAFDGEAYDSGASGWYLAIDGGGLTGSYPAVNQPRVYLLEEFRFDLTAGTLELRRDGSSTALAVVDDISTFRVVITLDDLTNLVAFSSTDDWSRIRSIRFLLAGERAVRGRTVQRSAELEVFPRNVLSL